MLTRLWLQPSRKGAYYSPISDVCLPKQKRNVSCNSQGSNLTLDIAVPLQSADSGLQNTCKTLQNREGNLKNKQPATLLDALLCFIQLNSILLNSFLFYATLVYSTPLHSTLLVFKNLPAQLLKLYSTPLYSTFLQEPARQILKNSTPLHSYATCLQEPAGKTF